MDQQATDARAQAQHLRAALAAIVPIGRWTVDALIGEDGRFNPDWPYHIYLDLTIEGRGIRGRYSLSTAEAETMKDGVLEEIARTLLQHVAEKLIRWVPPLGPGVRSTWRSQDEANT